MSQLIADIDWDTLLDLAGETARTEDRVRLNVYSQWGGSFDRATYPRALAGLIGLVSRAPVAI